MQPQFLAWLDTVFSLSVHHRGGYNHRGNRAYFEGHHHHHPHPHYAAAAPAENANNTRNTVYDNLVKSVDRTVFEISQSAHSRLRTDFNRLANLDNSLVAKDWSLQCGSLDTSGAVVRVNFTLPESPASVYLPVPLHVHDKHQHYPPILL